MQQPQAETKGMFIENNEGKPIEVTNLKEALAQARQFVRWHEDAKRNNNPSEGVYYIQEAHEYWADMLQKLERLSMKNSKLVI